jgi:parallel beta-helix repeat protein
MATRKTDVRSGGIDQSVINQIKNESLVELTSTQTGAGLESDGTYVPNTSTNYITTATSLKNADELLDAQIDTNTTSVTANTAGIASNTTAVAANATSIANNVTAIATNATGTSTNVTDIAANTTAIANSDTSIVTNTTAITTNAINIAANTANASGMATNASGIATNVTNITSNTADITANTAGITANTASTASNATNITSNAIDIASNTGNTATNTANIASNATNITTNAANIAANLASISSLNAATTVVYCDANSTHAETEDGTLAYPYKTLTAAITDKCGDADTDTVVFYLASGDYVGTINRQKSTTPIDYSDNQEVFIIGENKESVKIKGSASWNTSTGSVLYFRNFKNVSIQNLTIMNGAYGFYPRDCTTTSIKNCIFKHCGSSGDTTMHDGSGSAAEQAKYKWNSGDALATNTSDGGAMRVRNCDDIDIRNNTIEYSFRGFRIQDCKRGKVENNRVYKILDNGIYLAAGSYSGATTSGCEELSVVNNTVEYAGHHGLLAVGGRNNTFKNNVVKHSWATAYNGAHAVNVDLVDNYFYNNNSKDYNGYGAGSEHLAQVYAYATSAIDSSANTKYLLNLFNNVFEDCGDGSTSASRLMYINSSKAELPSHAQILTVHNNSHDCTTIYDIDDWAVSYPQTTDLSTYLAFWEEATSGDFLPITDDTYDIGSTAKQVKDIHVAGTSNLSAISVGGHILPTSNETYDIGSAEFKIRDAYISDSSLWVGDNHKIETKTDGKMKFRKRKQTIVPNIIVLLAAAQDPSVTANNAGLAALTLAGKPGTDLSILTLTDWLNYYQSLSGFDPNVTPNDFYRLEVSDDWLHIYEAADAGVDGAQGPQGDVGPQGAIGPAGPAGNTGGTGPIGPEGPQGGVGPQGNQGIQGVPGEDGPQGIQGVQGAAGTGINFKGTKLTTAALPTDGVIGDAWLVEADDSLHIHDGTTTSGNNGFVSGGSIQGPQGVKGDDGDQGVQGPQGAVGPDGAIGPAGPTGPQGGDGNDGAQGPQGIQGVQGLTGADGVAITFRGEVASHYALNGTSVALQPTGSFTPQAGDAVIAQIGTGILTNVFYVYDGTNWTSGGSIAGPTGPTGPTGTAGADGSDTKVVELDSDILVANFQAVNYFNPPSATADKTINLPTTYLDQQQALDLVGSQFSVTNTSNYKINLKISNAWFTDSGNSPLYLQTYIKTPQEYDGNGISQSNPMAYVIQPYTTVRGYVELEVDSAQTLRVTYNLFDIQPYTYNHAWVLDAGDGASATIQSLVTGVTKAAVTAGGDLIAPNASPRLEEVYLVDPNNGSTIVLPDPDNGLNVPSGFKYNIKNIGTSTLILETAGTSAKIDGADKFELTSQWSSVTLVCDGSHYFII